MTDDSPLLVLTVGLPHSGKSTWSRSAMKRFGFPIVSPDSFRWVLTGRRFFPPAEQTVWSNVHLAVRALFQSGHPVVVVDATNTTVRRRREWTGPWRLAYYPMRTPAQECIDRAIRNERPELVDVIRRMVENFESPEQDAGAVFFEDHNDSWSLFTPGSSDDQL